MREILFRGQTRRKGQKVRMDGSPVESNWVYGGIFQGLERSVMYGYDPIEKYVVYSDTVGQFTGLTDKNGKKIFEGDIIEWDELEWGDKHRELVEWDYSLFAIRKDDWGEWCEVIGNIHDDPELLEVE